MNPHPDYKANGGNPVREARTRSAGKSKMRSALKKIAGFFVLMFLGGIAGGAGIVAQGYLFFTHNLPSIEKLKHYEPPIVTNFYADGGELIAEFAIEHRYVVPIDDIPKTMQDAFLAAEDKNFWHHEGVDKEAILRAFWQNIWGGFGRSGGSTITQQAAKNFLLTPERTFTRKIKEAILSLRIEKTLDKKQILFLYLNQIYLGNSAYGVEAAARAYFGKHVNQLSIAECAMLGGLAKAPSKNNPKKNMKRALQRRAYVLGRMLEDGYISREEHDKAMNEELKLETWKNPHENEAAHFAEHVRRYIEKKYGADLLYKDGIKVYTTADLKLTQAAQSAMTKGLRELDKRQGYCGPIKTLNVKGVMDFLEERTKSRERPLRFGDITEGVITRIDDRHIDVRMGSYIKGNVKKAYLGKILINPSSNWWVRKPYIRAEMRTRNFKHGKLPFQVGDVILVRVVDPNIRRRELYRKKYGKTDPKMTNYRVVTEDMLDRFSLEPEQEPKAQAALMLRENRTGFVRVLLGGRTFDQAQQYNRAIQARRQPGSSFKPVIYAAALNKEFTCADMILDSPFSRAIEETGEVWTPKNYGGGFQGSVTFRHSLVHSRNIPTIKILQQIGMDHAKAYARKLGYTSPLRDDLTMALGSTGVSLEEQLNAYSVFPNQGYLVPAVYVKKIVDRNGVVLEEHFPPVFLEDTDSSDQQPRVQQASHDPDASSRMEVTADKDIPVLKRHIDEATAYIMTDLLQDVVRRGTATVLNRIVGRPDIAGKTGTTDESIDAWFMGFSPGYTCGVWVGFDEGCSLGEGETGGKAAAPIWGYFMKEVLKDTPVTGFPKSEAVEFQRIDPQTGFATTGDSGILEVFKAGTGPVHVQDSGEKQAPRVFPASDTDQF